MFCVVDSHIASSVLCFPLAENYIVQPTYLLRNEKIFLKKYIFKLNVYKEQYFIPRVIKYFI